MPENEGKGQYPAIDMQQFGNNLRQICEARKVSAHDLKEYLHLASIQAVYLWFGGKRLPSVDNLYAISRYLDVSIDELFCSEQQKGAANIMSDERLSAEKKRVLLYWTQLQKKKG